MDRPSDRRSVLDPVNVALLAELQKDPRVSVAALARRVEMSAPAVRDRVDRLEAAGIICGYRVDIDPAVVGLPVSAWVRIRPGPRQLARVAELARETPQVTECHRITGEDCFLLRVFVGRIEDLETVLDSFRMYGETTSSVVVSSPVEPRTVPVTGRP